MVYLYRVHMQNLRRKPENRSPDATCGPNLVYKRPFAGEFMKFCLERFKLGFGHLLTRVMSI
ncbi:unnamed protein product [Brassica napus]|uniref:(rape) hypothetical protein n=1 Tax=Brassica napus TaxID=3708 RepID=A0A816K6X0_BRANA|nr:unnamed protein product [Brassica napus]